jgi:hypothetical protein
VARQVAESDGVSVNLIRSPCRNVFVRSVVQLYSSQHFALAMDITPTTPELGGYTRTG